jgi:hypothetical protein
MIVVSDTTPLRHLIAIGEAELFSKPYGTVIVPGTVWTELQSCSKTQNLVSLVVSAPGGNHSSPRLPQRSQRLSGKKHFGQFLITSFLRNLSPPSQHLTA